MSRFLGEGLIEVFGLKPILKGSSEHILAGIYHFDDGFNKVNQVLMQGLKVSLMHVKYAYSGPLAVFTS